MWVPILAALLAVPAVFFIARRYFFALLDKRAAAFQAGLLGTYCDEVRNIYNDMRGWRHDYHNHIQTLKAFRHAGEDEKIDHYLNKLDADLSAVDKLIKSGNVTLDAILNSKLSLAASHKINVNVKASLPGSVSVSETDLCVIIGNLLDNAAEACAKLPEGAARFIRVFINVRRGHLYISVTNASPDKKSRYGNFASDKPGSHGFGLARVDRAVAKYGGYVKRAGEEGAFTTEILLPV